MSSYLKESLRQALQSMEKQREADPEAPPGPPAGGGRPASLPPVSLPPATPPPEPADPWAGARAAAVRVGAGSLSRGGGGRTWNDEIEAAYIEDHEELTDPGARAARAAFTPEPRDSYAAEPYPPEPAAHGPVMPDSGRFRPIEPHSLEEAGLETEFVTNLVVKWLLDHPGASGRQCAEALCLYMHSVLDLIKALKERKIVVFRAAITGGDFRCELTEEGRNLAADLRRFSRYVGPAPVPFDQYLLSIHEQSISRETPTMGDLRLAFQDLLVPERMLQQLGPALTSGKGLFLFGPPGNGKTSLAERITRAFGTAVYLPHAVLIEGHIVKVFDPMVHEALEEDPRTQQRTDPRWVRCRRPTVVAGGELTLDSLEIDHDEATGIAEAPIQVKAACGTLAIDDFGRQRIDPATLLNRWIVPLENRVDYLRLPDGRKVRVPFDPLLIFSTNLDPKDLCDEAFLRRIPYKINVDDPDEDAFRDLLVRTAEDLGFEPDEEVFDYLVFNYYKNTGRPFRFCHPRDLLLQIQNQCVFRQTPLRLSAEGIDEAALCYFTLL